MMDRLRPLVMAMVSQEFKGIRLMGIYAINMCSSLQIITLQKKAVNGTHTSMFLLRIKIQVRFMKKSYSQNKAILKNV